MTTYNRTNVVGGRRLMSIAESSYSAVEKNAQAKGGDGLLETGEKVDKNFFSSVCNAAVSSFSPPPLGPAPPANPDGPCLTRPPPSAGGALCYFQGELGPDRSYDDEGWGRGDSGCQRI